MENFEDDYALNLKLYYKQFNAGIDYINRQSSVTTYYKSIGTAYKDKGTLWNIRFINAYLKHQYDFSNKWQLSSQIYFRDAEVLDNSIQVINDTTQIGYYRPNNLFGFESLINYKSGQQLNLLVGIVYENEQVADGYSNTYSVSADKEPPKPDAPPKEINQLYSVYLQAQYFIWKPLSLTMGSRFDISSVYDKVLMPRLGLVYHKNRLTSKLLYMHAYRAPKPWDYNDGAGNQNLQPEEMQSLEWCTIYNISDKIRFNISFYKNILEEIINRQEVGNSWRWVNEGRVNTDGMETVLEYRTGKINAYLNYTYNNSYDEDNHQIAEIAKHTANGGLIYNWTRNFKINLRGNYLGERKNPVTISATGNSYINDALIFYSTLSLLNIHKFNFYFIVKNIFDTKYFHTSNRSTINRYRQPQRTLMIKTEIKL
jgi:outer membrane receptor for ferrienterochelin and colicin